MRDPNQQLAGHRAMFTRARELYYESDDPESRANSVQVMAKRISSAQANGISKEQVINGQTYPAEEVQRILDAQPEGGSEGQ